MTITTVILTYNESLHIARAIKSVTSISKKIIVVDSFSSDRTTEIAENLGAVVYQRKFINQAEQFNWALDNLEINSEWILRLDADEIIEPDLAANISRILPSLNRDIVGINLKRKHIFMGRWVRYGGRYPLLMLRLWRNKHGRIEERWMDEHAVVWGGSTITLDGGFSDHNLNNLTFFTDKHNKYATREAIEVIAQRRALFQREERLSGATASRQAHIKRLIKERLYNRIPFTISACLYFLWRYIFQLGFLDGRSGLVYHFLQGYWYRFLVGAKVMELASAISHLHDKEDIIEELSRLTGHELN